MSTYTSEPGTRLAGRYRLVDQVSAGNGWTLWKAIDETLARPVSVLTFAPGFPRIPQVVTAARAASRLTDPRMAQVFDVEDGGGQAYVVLEWVGGESLADLLEPGPLDISRACALICDAARAVAGAHAVGQAHLMLTPDNVRWTRGSGIKITGVGVDAALAGDGLTAAAADDPSVADTVALASLLYAALTGYWPGPEPTRLPPAPVHDGVVVTAYQVSADVPSAIDNVITRALLQRPTRQGPPIQSPAEFADAVAAVAPPVPLPEPAPAPQPYPGSQSYPGPQPYDSYRGYGPDPNDPDTWQGDRGAGGTAPYPPPSGGFPMAAYGGAPPAGARYPAPAAHSDRRRGGPSRAMFAVVVVLVLAIIGATVWAVGFRDKTGSSPGTGSGTNPTTSASPSAGTTVLKPTGVITFNVFGSPPGNTEDKATAGNAIDGSTSTAWATSWYLDNPVFGGESHKTGTGLLIDMGKQVRLSQVEVLFGVGPTDAEIYLGNSAAFNAGLSNFKLVSPGVTATGNHAFPVSGKDTGRYVLIWITKLPKLNKKPEGAPGGHGYYQAWIYNVVVRGSAVSGSS
jgi:serine/threonine protein kinase